MASRVSYSTNEGQQSLIFSTRALAEAYAKSIKNAVVSDCDEQTSTRFTRLGTAREEEHKRWFERHGTKIAATETHEAYVHMPIGYSSLDLDDETNDANRCVFCSRKCGQAIACYNCRKLNAGG
jgi:dipeptidyl aminopeptidase/acylaminoacyl peptidase